MPDTEYTVQKGEAVVYMITGKAKGPAPARLGAMSSKEPAHVYQE